MTIEQRIDLIEERNRKVETDKAWETSKTRKVLLVLFTYVVVSLFMKAVGVSRPWINALIPSAGFMISTLALPWCKRLWIKSQKRSV